MPTSETTPVDTIVSTGKAKKGDKRKYTKSAQGSAWTEFSAMGAEITAQVKSEGEPKKVAGEVGKRLGALWKEAKENPKSGSNNLQRRK